MAAAAVTLDALKREARALELRIESRLNEHARLDGAAADVESGSAEAAAAREIDAALLSVGRRRFISRRSFLFPRTPARAR